MLLLQERRHSKQWMRPKRRQQLTWCYIGYSRFLGEEIGILYRFKNKQWRKPQRNWKYFRKCKYKQLLT